MLNLSLEHRRSASERAATGTQRNGCAVECGLESPYGVLQSALAELCIVDLIRRSEKLVVRQCEEGERAVGRGRGGQLEEGGDEGLDAVPGGGGEVGFEVPAMVMRVVLDVGSSSDQR